MTTDGSTGPAEGPAAQPAARRLLRADEPHARVARAVSWNRSTLHLLSKGSLAGSVALHGLVLGGLLWIAAARVPLEGVGTNAAILLSHDLAATHEADVEELELVEVSPPDILEPIAEPQVEEAREVEVPPEPVEDLLPPLEEVVDPAEVPELSITVVDERVPRRRPPPPAPPPPVLPRPRPAAPVLPPKPVPAARPAPVAPRPAAPRPGRLVPVRTPRSYPAEARRRGLTGRVRVEVLVSPQGAVVDARLVTSCGHGVLDAAAVRSARQWRFRPPGALRRAVIPFLFRLD